ncbi:MAG: hypothetical protein V4634_12990 [Pseudomonadota bacterium]
MKMRFPKTIPDREWRTETRRRRGERGIWQRRYCEHLIKSNEDFAAHMEYVHINPLKHGLVSRVAGWPSSTFHRLAEEGAYPTH